MTISYIGKTSDYWIRVQLDGGPIASVPYGLKLERTGTKNRYKYFKILEGVYKGRLASINSAGSGYFSTNVHHQAGVTVNFDLKSQSLTFGAVRLTLFPVVGTGASRRLLRARMSLRSRRTLLANQSSIRHVVQASQPLVSNRHLDHWLTLFASRCNLGRMRDRASVCVRSREGRTARWLRGSEPGCENRTRLDRLAVARSSGALHELGCNR